MKTMVVLLILFFSFVAVSADKSKPAPKKEKLGKTEKEKDPQLMKVRERQSIKVFLPASPHLLCYKYMATGPDLFPAKVRVVDLFPPTVRVITQEYDSVRSIVRLSSGISFGREDQGQ